MRVWRFVFWALLTSLGWCNTSLAAPPTAASNSDLLIILDASGSMWGRVQGAPKIDIARSAVKDIVDGLAVDARVGLLVYGHRRKSDCSDIEVLMPPAPIDKPVLARRIDALNPKGKTPITKAVNEAFKIAKSSRHSNTIVLVSDGIESCGGDPCRAVREAKKSGIDFVMHVVGFDVGKVNVAQLECAAQAGGGLYLSAKNAGELTAALNRVTADIPAGRLSVKTLANGKLQDALVRVFDAKTGKEIETSRTYASSDTNPRILPLSDGDYTVKIQAIAMKGEVQQTLNGIEIKNGSRVEKTVDFSPGALRLRVTRNSKLSDATIQVYPAGQRRQVAGGRTYKSTKTNPITLNLTAGRYDIVIGSVEIKGKFEQRIEGVDIKAGETVDREWNFVSGRLRVGVARAGKLVDAVVRVRRIKDGGEAATGRTYASPDSNPKTFELPPGTYKVSVHAVKSGDKPKRDAEISVMPGQVAELKIEL
jgi:Ca-activated chloride channel homolog